MRGPREQDESAAIKAGRIGGRLSLSSLGSHAQTVLEEIRRFVTRLSPDAVCDDCIAERLQLSVRQHASHKTRELAGSGGFERSKDRCSLCGADKLVIRKS